MSGYAPAYPSGSAPGPSSDAQAASTSTDPYAPFYFWDATTNQWAFDYNSYYAAYGYPADYADPNAMPSASTQAAYDPYAANAAYGADPNAIFGPAYPVDPNAPPQTVEAGKQEPIRDENGRIIPGKLKKGETRETVLRKGAGKVWEDQTLLEWDPSHKRLFVGDLGNDVSDQTLSAAFEKYPSFSKARVVRKKDGKGRGYGFVAFADPEDFLRAWKEMDGKYIGSRPCRLKKATEEVKAVTIGARKDKMLAISAKLDQEAYKTKMGGAIGKHLRRQGGSGKPYAK
ncbi:uncharacterized protein PFL1_04174 [Pseudozyma flocculosa PF-1]|uniref:Related to RNA-binding protein n=2 Tax=Pseudozyma flocculosa TaxID=84751 RepID=A0A5C3EWH9_9BASI|nr:uncharacterized protein PFL1_04174 [Pseudozyma flocculosa PF-1]EPQ28347.1 hypothetical protein PFL1_04174 [Pseudozyma flocculosa PF-1]SPO35499.1 related to RNA-binding protein [Pseudozyma flocculosa]